MIQPPHRQDLVAMSLTRTSLVYVTWVYHQLHIFLKNIQVANLILPYNDIFVIESAAFKLLIKFVYYLSPTPVDIDQDQITIWLIHSSYISTNLYFRGKINKCISIMINFISTLKRINHYIIYRIKHFLKCFMVKKRKHGGYHVLYKLLFFKTLLWLRQLRKWKLHPESWLILIILLNSLYNIYNCYLFGFVHFLFLNIQTWLWWNFSAVLL